MTDKLILLWERHKLKVIGLALIVFFVVLAVRTENTRNKVIEVQRVERTTRVPVEAFGKLTTKQRADLLALINRPVQETRTVKGNTTVVNRTVIVKGRPGPVGPQGPAGERGRTGKTGQIGQEGLPGVRGPQGPVGATGEAGNSTSVADVVSQVLERLAGIVDAKVRALLQSLGLAPR